LVDVGVANITTPPLNCPTSGVFLQATVKNYNTTTLDFAVHPVTVNAVIAGAASGTVTAVLNSGTLAPGASTDVYLSPSFNFTAAGVYTITATTVNPDDPETGNDSYATSAYITGNPATPVITPSSVQLCIGQQAQLSTQFVPSPPPVVANTSSGTLNIAIPDDNPVGITNTIAVSGIPAGATITNFSVTINKIAHTFDGDLIISLKGPNGKIVNLFNQEGLAGDSIINMTIADGGASLVSAAAPFTGTYAPDALAVNPPGGFTQTSTTLAGLYLGLPNGNWTLAVSDNAFLDAGILRGWTVNVTYQFVTPTITWTPTAGLFTDVTTTTAYPAGTNAYSLYTKPNATTTYTVTATTPAGCTSSASALVTVNPYPVVTIGSIPDTVCISDPTIPLSASPVGGSWSGIGVSGLNFIPSSTAIGTYTLTYTYANAAGCTTTATKKIAVKDCPERVIELRDNAVLLYPNPTSGQFNIQINSVLYSYLNMKVFTSGGALVRTQQFGGLAWGRVIPIDISNLPGGVYMVKFYYDGGVRTEEKTFKVIVSR
jgi:subtilisin-like proprotein convertase family protein